jgi:TPR repeat protein
MDFQKTVRMPSATVVGDFRLVRPLGEGNFGTVYEAVHVPSGLPYAVKRLLPSDEPERFEKEALYPARAARQSIHVLNIHSFFRSEDGTFYLATELIANGDLSRFLREHAPLDPKSAIEIGIGIARGLAAIHKDGIVHLDLKPGNVLMDRKDERWVPKIGDFGLARSDGSVSLNQYGSIGYASPEHFDGRVRKTAASDVFSLGMVLYELLTGEKASGAASLTEYAAWIARGVPPPPPSHRREELQGRDDLDRLLEGLLQFEPMRRTLSAADVATRLAEALEPRISTPPPANRAVTPRASVETISKPPKVPSRRAAVVALASLLVVASIGLGAWGWRQAASSRKDSDGIVQFRAKHYAAALPALLDDARGGNAEAQRALGQIYAGGLGVSKNPAEGRKWLDQAIAQDDDEARCVLADLWRGGDFGTRDVQRARELFEAASANRPCGHHGLGELTLNGDVPGSFDDGLRHLERASEAGYTDAAIRLREVHAAWGIGPLVQGPWQTMAGSERRAEIARLKVAGVLDRMHARDVRRLRRLMVDFYDGAALFELEVGLGAAGVGAVEFLRKNDVLTVLDGRAAHIYEFNTTAPVRLDTLPRAAAYLRFFLASVQGASGIFRVVDAPGDLAWASPGSAGPQETVTRGVRPWHMEPSASGGWRAAGTVAYNRGLLRAEFDVRNSGMVNLSGQEQLAADLPLAVERFQAPGLRVAVAANTGTRQ